jgi:PTS system ascorbate-specific IIC component
MAFLSGVVSVLSQPSVVLAIVAALGLILLKKSVSQVIVGTLKTILGFLMLNAGSSIIITALSSFSSVFTEAFHLAGFMAEDNAIAAAVQTALGFETSMIMVLAFVINLLIARFTKWKYIFLTGHMMFSFAATMAIVLDQMGLNGWPAIMIGSVVQGISQVLFPALAQPSMRELTGKDDVAFGFWGSGLVWLCGRIGGKLGNKEQSAEELKVSQNWSFLKDMSVLMSVVMIVVYLATFLYAGNEIVSQYSGGMSLVQFAVDQALEFVVGTLVLLQGVRMFLGELVPAFKGISTRLIPGAIPALDIPILYAYGPVSTTLGFIFALIGALLATAISTHMSAVILPSVIGIYFMGAGAGVFGNKFGGRRGAIIAGFLLGFFFSIIPVIFYNWVDLSVYGISGLWFASTDAILVLVIMRLVGMLFGVSL